MLQHHCNNLLKQIEEYKQSIEGNIPKIQRDDRINDPIKLFDLIKLHPNYNYNKYAVILGVSEATIKRRIKQLKEEGKIVRKGAKTGIGK